MTTPTPCLRSQRLHRHHVRVVNNYADTGASLVNDYGVICVSLASIVTLSLTEQCQHLLPDICVDLASIVNLSLTEQCQHLLTVVGAGSSAVPASCVTSSLMASPTASASCSDPSAGQHILYLPSVKYFQNILKQMLRHPCQIGWDSFIIVAFFINFVIKGK